MFGCFVDFSKAFDRVNYWKLFSQLLDDGVMLCTVTGVLVFESDCLCIMAGLCVHAVNFILAIEHGRVVFCHHTCSPAISVHC